MVGIPDCIVYSTRPVIPQPTEWQRIADQTNAAMIVARSHFVNVRRTLRVAGRLRIQVSARMVWIDQTFLQKG
jgi:hypothetical protein